MRLLRPEALWLLLLAVPLALLHLRFRRRLRVVVPSLLAWDPSSLGGAPPRAAGLRPRDLLGLLLEVAALSCLAVFAAGPVEGDPPPPERPLALVLDGSASTLAAGRFEEMRGLARRALEAAGPRAPASLWIAAGEAAAAAPPGSPRPVLEAALAAARPRAVGSGGLAAAAEAALGNGGEVLVLTDGCDPDAPALAARKDLRLLSVGRPERNRAVVGAAVELRRPRTGSLFLRVRGEDGRILEEDRSAEFARALAAGEGGGLFGFPGGGDALPLDDLLRITADPPGGIRVGVVADSGATDPWLAAALEACGDALDRELSVALRPEGLPNLGPGIDVLVGGPGLASLGRPRLLLAAGEGPPREAPTLQAGEGRHPVLRGVDPAEWMATRGRALPARAGDAVLLLGPEGPLALAGEREGARVVILGFDPAESTLPLSGSWPVFLRNALLWLAGDPPAPPPPTAADGSPALLDAAESDLVPRVPRNAEGFEFRARGPAGGGPRSRAADFGLAAALLLLLEWWLWRGADPRRDSLPGPRPPP